MLQQEPLAASICGNPGLDPEAGLTLLPGQQHPAPATNQAVSAQSLRLITLAFRGNI